MINARCLHPKFHEGDEVVLSEGTYQGTAGVFLQLREDAKWADISESDGTIRSHPVAWLTFAQPHGQNPRN